MNNRTIAHEWANQTRQSRAGSHFYFEGPALYSYGSHFIVGLIVGDGPARCALMNSKSYSNSTSKHQGFARGAASHLVQFNAPAVGTTSGDVATNYAHYVAEIEAAQMALMRARTATEAREYTLRRIVKEAAQYSEYFPLSSGNASKETIAARRRIRAIAAALAAGTLISDKDRATITKKVEAARVVNAAANKARAERAEAARKEAEAKMSEWVAGVADVRPPSHWMPGSAELPTRLRIKGAAVETSRGAVVSCRAARVLWARIKAGKDIIGAVVDGYTVSGWNGALKIGCHTIDRAEVERIGALLDARDVAKDEEKTGGAVAE